MWRGFPGGNCVMFWIADQGRTVHAINDKAREFCPYFGFEPSPIATNTLFYKI